MDFEKIKDITNSVDKSSLTEFELKLQDGFYIRMSKLQNANTTNNINNAEPMQNTPVSTQVKEESVFTQTADIKQEVAQEIEGKLVLAPIVGTFYRASSPDTPPYIQKGDKVEEGDIVCIIEAMKVMNEIKCEHSGTVAEIYAQDEDMVEYGKPLFKIV